MRILAIALAFTASSLADADVVCSTMTTVTVITDLAPAPTPVPSIEISTSLASKIESKESLVSSTQESMSSASQSQREQGYHQQQQESHEHHQQEHQQEMQHGEQHSSESHEHGGGEWSSHHNGEHQQEQREQKEHGYQFEQGKHHYEQEEHHKQEERSEQREQRQEEHQQQQSPATVTETVTVHECPTTKEAEKVPMTKVLTMKEHDHGITETLTTMMETSTIPTSTHVTFTQMRPHEVIEERSTVIASTRCEETLVPTVVAVTRTEYAASYQTSMVDHDVFALPILHEALLKEGANGSNRHQAQQDGGQIWAKRVHKRQWVVENGVTRELSGETQAYTSTMGSWSGSLPTGW